MLDLHSTTTDLDLYDADHCSTPRGLQSHLHHNFHRLRSILHTPAAPPVPVPPRRVASSSVLAGSVLRILGNRPCTCMGPVVV